AEPSELPHRPQLAAIAGRVNAAGERIRAGNAEAFGALRIDVEGGVQWFDLARRIHERDVAQLAGGVAAAPFGELRAQAIELGSVVGGVAGEISRRRHSSFRIKRFTLRAT